MTTPEQTPDVGSPSAPNAPDVAALYDLEARSMLRMATLLVGSAAIAEEVVHDAFAAVGERWHEIDRKGAYLRKTIVHGCAAVLRRRDLEARHRQREPQPRHAEMPTHLIELRDAMERLSERQRLVVVLRYFVDVPDREIATMLDVRPATVRSLAHRALDALRHELGEEAQ